MAIAILTAIFALILWYALAGRAWLKTKTWARGFFTIIEPAEIALFKKSETILVGRFLWFGGFLVTAYDSLAVYAGGLDMTPLTTRFFDLLKIPDDLRGITVTGIIAGIGLLMNWLRKRVTQPLDVVAVATKDVTPSVAQAIRVADNAKDDAIAAVSQAKAS